MQKEEAKNEANFSDISNTKSKLSCSHFKGKCYVIVRTITVEGDKDESVIPETFKINDTLIIDAINTMGRLSKTGYTLDGSHILYEIKYNPAKESSLDAVRDLFDKQLKEIEKGIKKANVKVSVHTNKQKFFFKLHASEEEKEKAVKSLYGMQLSLWIPSIKTLRMLTGLTQCEFGEKYLIPMRSIQNWETGDRESTEYIRYLLMENILTDINHEANS